MSCFGEAYVDASMPLAGVWSPPRASWLIVCVCAREREGGGEGVTSRASKIISDMLHTCLSRHMYTSTHGLFPTDRRRDT